MRHRKLPTGVYDTEVHALFGRRDELNAFFRRTCDAKEEEISKGSCGHHCTWVPDDPRQYTRRYVAIVTDATRDNRERRHVLVHEVVHCAVSIFDDKGVKYSGGNDEQLAYFVEWLYKECEPVLSA